jgi:hypothetical protein
VSDNVYSVNSILGCETRVRIGANGSEL